VARVVSFLLVVCLASVGCVSRHTLALVASNGRCEMPKPTPDLAPGLEEFNDHEVRVRALMQCLQFALSSMPTEIRLFRYQPAWFLDTAMVAKDGKVWVTYWPKTESSHPPEYLGQLYGGRLHHFVLPQEPYYFLKLPYYVAPVPVVDGLQLETGKLDHLAILSNGSVINSRLLPANLKGHDQPALCKQGSRASSVALYGLLPNGRWQAILSWRNGRLQLWGCGAMIRCILWNALERFAGYFWVIYGSAGTGAIFRVKDGNIVPAAIARPYLVTDHAMILSEGDQLIKAYSP